MNMNLAGLKAFVSDFLPLPVAARNEFPAGKDDFVDILNDRRERAAADEFPSRKPEHAASREDHDDRAAALRERDDHATWRNQDESARADRGHSSEHRQDDHHAEPATQDDAGESAEDTSTQDSQAAEQTDSGESEPEDTAAAGEEPAADSSTPVDDGEATVTQITQVIEQPQADESDDASQAPIETASIGEPVLDVEIDAVAAAPVEEVVSADEAAPDDAETGQTDTPVVSAGSETPVLETPVLETPELETPVLETPENTETPATVQTTDNANDAGVATEQNYPALRGLGQLRAGEVGQDNVLPNLFVLPEGSAEVAGIQDIISQFTNRMKGGVSTHAVQGRAPQGVNITNMAANNANASAGNPGNMGGNAANTGNGSGGMANSMSSGSLPSVTPTSLPGALPLSGDASFANQLALETPGSESNRTGLVNNTPSAANTARAAGPQTTAGIQVAIHLTRAIQDGLDRINIRLNPAELGRVDVRLEVRHDGTTMAIVTADRQETLDLLQRDARGLERALQEAGMKTDSGSMSFNLRQNGQNNAENASNGTSGGQGNDDTDAAGADIVENQLPVVDPNRLLDIIV